MLFLFLLLDHEIKLFLLPIQNSPKEIVIARLKVRITYIPASKLILRLLEDFCELFFCNRVTKCLRRLNSNRQPNWSHFDTHSIWCVLPVIIFRFPPGAVFRPSVRRAIIESVRLSVRRPTVAIIEFVMKATWL